MKKKLSTTTRICFLFLCLNTQQYFLKAHPKCNKNLHTLSKQELINEVKRFCQHQNKVPRWGQRKKANQMQPKRSRFSQKRNKPPFPRKGSLPPRGPYHRNVKPYNQRSTSGSNQGNQNQENNKSTNENTNANNDSSANLDSNCPEVEGNYLSSIAEGGSTCLKIKYKNGETEETREFYAYTPEGFSNSQKKYPLFFIFHGSGPNAVGAAMGNIQNNKGSEAIIISPVGTEVNISDDNNGRTIYGWNVKGQNDQNDVALTKTLYEAIKDDDKIDSDAIYAYGSSMGSSFLANNITDPDLSFIRGITNFSSTFLAGGNIPEQTTEKHVIIVAGSCDKIIPWNGGVSEKIGDDEMSIEDALALWAQKNSCQGDLILSNSLTDFAEDSASDPSCYQQTTQGESSTSSGSEKNTDYVMGHYQGCNKTTKLYLMKTGHNTEAKIPEWTGKTIVNWILDQYQSESSIDLSGLNE